MDMHGFNIGDKVLVTTDAWFFGPDGRHYRGAWGTLHGIASDSETLGVKTNARSTNWYARVGGVLIAGCQIHYAVECPQCPPRAVDDFEVKDGVVRNFVRPSSILDADAV